MKITKDNIKDLISTVVESIALTEDICSQMATEDDYEGDELNEYQEKAEILQERIGKVLLANIDKLID